MPHHSLPIFWTSIQLHPLHPTRIVASQGFDGAPRLFNFLFLGQRVEATWGAVAWVNCVKWSATGAPDSYDDRSGSRDTGRQNPAVGPLSTESYLRQLQEDKKASNRDDYALNRLFGILVRFAHYLGLLLITRRRQSVTVLCCNCNCQPTNLPPTVSVAPVWDPPWSTTWLPIWRPSSLDSQVTRPILDWQHNFSGLLSLEKLQQPKASSI